MNPPPLAIDFRYKKPDRLKSASSHQTWGGCFDASPVSGSGVMRRESIGAPTDRTSIEATPGITVGMRMMTKEFIWACIDLLEDILATHVGKHRVGSAAADTHIQEIVHIGNASTLHTPHPAAEAQSTPGADTGVDCCAKESTEECRAGIGINENMPDRSASGSGVVIEVDSAKETVLRSQSVQKTGEGPLNNHEYGHEEQTGNKRNLPELPAMRALPEKIQNYGRDKDQNRKRRRNHVGDWIEDRAKLWFRRKKGKDQNLAYRKHGVDRR